MSLQDNQYRRTSKIRFQKKFFQPYSNKTLNKFSTPADENTTGYGFLAWISKIIKKDVLKIVTKFPCLLAHPVSQFDLEICSCPSL